MTAIRLLAAAWAASVGACKALEDTIDQHEENVRQARTGPAPKEPEAIKNPIELRDVTVRPSATDRLRDLPPHSAEGQLRELIKLRVGCSDGECAKRILGKIREDQAYLSKGLPVLLEGEPPPITMEALRLAGLLQLGDLVPAIGRRLTDPEPEVRAEAIWALGALRSQASLKELGELRVRGLERAERGLVCRAVSEIGLPEGAELIGWLLGGADPDGRATCVEALARLPGEASLAKLEALTSDTLPEVRDAALRGLRTRSEARARHLLEQRGIEQRRPPQGRH